MPELYRNLIQQCFPPAQLSEDSPLMLDELELQSHWFSGHFGTEFTSTEGHDIVIKQLGFWNRTAGPDFLHCTVEVDGESHTGPIELDLNSHHWTQHAHHSNEAFNKVILHVVFEADSVPCFTRTSNHRHVPKVVIPRDQIVKALGSGPVMETTSHPGRCSTPLATASDLTITRLLESAVRHRMSLKSLRARQNSHLHGSAQTLWMQIAETLGYRANQSSFKILAQRIPIQVLATYNEHEIQSILFGMAGFLHPDMHQSAPDDSREWLEELWQTWWLHRQDFEFDETRKIHWSLSGSRPVNHPQRRLAALAQIAINWHRIRLCRSLEELNDLLLDLQDPFWNHHYTLSSKRTDQHLKLIGQDRINELMINHLLPCRMTSSEDGYWVHFQSFKAGAVSERVSRAANRLLGTHPSKESFLKKAWQHQAFLQLYQDFCLKDHSDCDDCPFPEQLKVWASSSVK